MKSFLLLLPLCCALTVHAGTGASVSVKQHSEHSIFQDRAYGDSDMSYGAFYEVRENNGFWRFGAHFASGLSDKENGTAGVDSIITPEIALIGTEGFWKSGLGMLMDYVDADGKTDWGDVYFQFQLGFEMPVSNSFLVGIHAYFPFEDLDGVVDFDTDDLDYGLDLTMRF